MDSQPWPEQLRSELRRQGLPPRYIDRLVEELADHVLDSQTEHASMEAQPAFERLGTTTHLAAAARREFDLRSFAGRHPWLTFALGPVAFVPILFVSLMAGTTAILWVIATTCEWLAPSWPSAETLTRLEPWILAGYDAYVRFIPFALAALIFCRWGRGCHLRRWPLLACAIVAIIAGFFVTKLTPATPDQPGLWVIGFGFRPELRQLLQLVPPLAIAGWFLVRNYSSVTTALRLPSPG